MSRLAYLSCRGSRDTTHDCSSCCSAAFYRQRRRSAPRPQSLCGVASIRGNRTVESQIADSRRSEHGNACIPKGVRDAAVASELSTAQNRNRHHYRCDAASCIGGRIAHNRIRSSSLRQPSPQGCHKPKRASLVGPWARLHMLDVGQGLGGLVLGAVGDRLRLQEELFGNVRPF